MTMKTEKVEVDRITVVETQDLILPVDSYVKDEDSQLWYIAYDEWLWIHFYILAKWIYQDCMLLDLSIFNAPPNFIVTLYTPQQIIIGLPIDV